MEKKPTTGTPGRGRPKGSKGTKTTKKGQPTGGPSDKTNEATKSPGRKKGSGNKPKGRGKLQQIQQQAANAGYAKSFTELVEGSDAGGMMGFPGARMPAIPGRSEVANPFGSGMCPGSIRVYPREDWKAIEPSGQLNPMTTMASNVRFLHTGEGSERCKGQESCFRAVQNLQKKHMQEGLHDINYNFMVAEDGSVYIGRDWDADCDRSEEYQDLKGDCYDIVFLGDFSNTTEVPATMLLSGYNMIAYGHDKQKIKRDPRVLRNMDFNDNGILDKCLKNYFEKLYSQENT